jgi:hypothetical protein
MMTAGESDRTLFKRPGTNISLLAHRVEARKSVRDRQVDWQEVPLRRYLTARVLLDTVSGFGLA